MQWKGILAKTDITYSAFYEDKKRWDKINIKNNSNKHALCNTIYNMIYVYYTLNYQKCSSSDKNTVLF